MTDIVTVPRNESERLELLAVRPPAWEYLLFGASLHSGLTRTESKWRDYQLGYTMDIGPIVPKDQLVEAMQDRLTRVTAIASNVERVISKQAQDAAFGLPGEPGDPDLIEHMGGRVIMLYEQLLDWAAEMRSLRLPDNAASLPELGVALGAQPILASRTFAKDFVVILEAELAKRILDPQYSPNITMGITFDLEAGDSKAFVKAIKRAMR